MNYGQIGMETSKLLSAICACVLFSTYSATVNAASLITPFFQERYVEVSLDGITEQTAMDFLLFDAAVFLSLGSTPFDDAGTALRCLR